MSIVFAAASAVALLLVILVLCVVVQDVASSSPFEAMGLTLVVCALIHVGALAAIGFDALERRSPPVERAITTQAEECRCTCTRREP